VLIISDKKVFDPKKIHLLESKERQSYLNTKEILHLLDLHPNYILADLGCGSGVFTIPLSKEVKQVFAIDVEPKMIDVVNQKILQKKIKNIKTMLSYDNKIPLENDFLDLLITVNTLHEFRNLDRTLQEIYRVLKPSGKVAVVDFKKKKEGFGPPENIRISSRKARTIFSQYHFKVLKTIYLRFDYFLFLEKRV
jgi:ubiquinone/menaquinone biosynthesis C-methylase UbiE